MSVLRQRPLSVEKSIDGSQKVDEPQINGHVYNPRPKSSFALNGCLLLLLSALATSVFLYQTTSITTSGSYALCSREGQHIYTVDETNSRAQCVVVHDSHIVNTGSLGWSSCQSRSPLLSFLILIAEDVKKRWNSFPLTLQEISQYLLRPPLTIRYIKEGSIVVPGLSGLHSLTPSILSNLISQSRFSRSHSRIWRQPPAPIRCGEKHRRLSALHFCSMAYQIHSFIV